MPDNNSDTTGSNQSPDEQQADAQQNTPDSTAEAAPPAPSGDGYRENSSAHEELQKAVETVPIKDYSDYEITIETKDHYEDALFSDEDDLDNALTQAVEEQQNSDNANSASQSEKNNSSEEEPTETNVDFSLFLTEQAKLGFPDQTTEGAATKTSIINNSLNDSPARKTIPLNEKFDQFEKTLADIAEKIETEKELAAAAAQDKLKVDTKADPEASKFSSFAQKIKAKSKEISLKGIAQLDKSKSGLDEYLGRTLPERTLALEFILPTLKSKKEQERIINKQEIEKLFSLKGKALASTLNKTNSELGKLSKTSLSNSNRLELLDTFSPLLEDKIESIISMFERKPSVVDEGKRVSILDNALSAIKHLITGYKQVYADIYESTNVIYGPQRNTANDTALKILLCLQMEQRLAIATHSNISNSSAKTFNKVFHALKLYEPQILNNTESLPLSTDSKTITEAFLQYQLFLAFDFKVISSSLHRALHSYLKHHSGLLEMIDPELSDRLDIIDAGQQLWQCSHSESTPKFFNHQQSIDNKTDASGQPAYVKIQNLFNQIKTDYVAALKFRVNQRREFNPAALKDIDITMNQALSLLSALNKLIIQCETNTSRPAYTVYRPVNISAYTSYQHLIEYYKHAYAVQVQGPKNKGTARKDMPIKPLASKSNWQCAIEDHDVIHLQTSEDKLGIKLDISDLVLLIRSIDADADEESDSAIKDIEDKILGKVIRLERGPQGKLIVEIKKLAEELCTIDNDTSRVLCKSETSHRLITETNSELSTNQQFDFNFPDSSKGVLAIAGLEHTYNGGDIFTLV